MSKKETELVLRDLHGLLREIAGDEVTVVKYETSNLLPKGENYASTMLKVDVVIKKSKNTLEEQLPLVAKMIPTTKYEQSHFNSTVSFNKEMFVYKTLVPAFRQLEKEVGIKDDDLIDVTPKYYGGRISLNEEKLDVADEDAIILLENLKEHGYNMMDRKKGLDLDHARLAVAELARFHALSIAMKEKKSEFFETAKKALKDFPFEMKENTNVGELINQLISTVCEDPRIAEYEDRIRKNAEANKNWESLLKVEPTEPWISIVHGDFWVNNIMFKQENGQPKDVKFLDFQLTRVSSPTKDLPYFLCANIQTSVIGDHFDELLDLYYETLIKVLIKTNCNIGPFTRKSFDEELNKDAGHELLRCLWVIKCFTEDFDNDEDLDDVLNSVKIISKSNSAYLERSWAIVWKFVEKGWI